MSSQMTRGQKAAATRKARKESDIRIAAAQAETLRVWNTGVCPRCGAGLRINRSMAGWVQCDQYGAVGFRADDSKPSCSYQGFMK
jgi:hypothetical protein